MSGRGRSLARAPEVTSAELEKLQRLHGEGLNCRQISRELGRAPVTVSKYAKQLGLSFDRTQTKQATAARVADLASARAETSARFLAEADRILSMMSQPRVRLSRIGGAHNTYTEAIAPGWPPAELRDLMNAAGIAFDRHLAQARQDQTPEAENSDVDRWLRHMLGEEPPPSKSDADESAKHRTLLGGLFDHMVAAVEADENANGKPG
jgi:hypothetical protein